MESLDRTFENVCELDLVFHFDEVRVFSLVLRICLNSVTQVHHILSEVIQGGLVLETNVEEIDHQGNHLSQAAWRRSLTPLSTTSSESAQGVVYLCQPTISGLWRRWRRVKRKWPTEPRLANREADWCRY